MSHKIRTHLPLLLIGMISLIAALAGGLIRLGWEMPPRFISMAFLHGPLMISGFLGTLIGLERAVALGHRWTYMAPVLTGTGAIILVTGLDAIPGPILMTAGSLFLVFIFYVIFRLQPALHAVVMGVGAFSWFIGNILWLMGRPLHQIVLWWVGFLVLTIAGERLELTRMLQPSRRSRLAFIVCASTLFAGIILSSVTFDIGMRLSGAGMTFLALWLFRYDIAKRTVQQSGLTRFIALCLLSGYVWLMISGLLALFYGGAAGGPVYDAILHSVFIGFVFVMIFGHAPIIFPAVLGVSIFFKKRFYIHMVLLHITLIVRVSGDLLLWMSWRQWGGLLNALAILLFFINTVSATRITGRQ